MITYPSKLFEEAVNEFSRLPGIGRKSALRMVLHLLKFNKEEVNRFGEALINLRQQISYCKNCHNISETEVCNICSDHKHDRLL